MPLPAPAFPSGSQTPMPHPTASPGVPAPSPALAMPASASASESVGEKRKSNYFEFAKKKWESEEAFRLPDGTCAFLTKQARHLLRSSIVCLATSNKAETF